ncbi:MAG: CHASE3 domain-containing protein [Devosia sp.]|uniref:sensor histidine kinase n=1 Tax=Devosia sp. TaxID=1871048 RepID=UPI0024CAF32A|nr:ATP-binding protein [Devosia sp.]UYO00780.1 MAG: CHASE3 domain-containing protein [Devosia sp.]
MPISSKTLVRSTALLLLVGLLALVGIVGTTIWLVERTQLYFNEVIEAREARSAAVDLRAMVQDAIASERGYIITQDNKYLEPYLAAVPQIDETLARLESVLLPYPQAAEPMQQLREDITFKLSEMARIVDLVQGGQRAEAAEIIRTDTGKEAMDRANTFFAGLISAADMRLEQGADDQRSTANLLRIVSVVGALVIFGVVGGAIVVALKYTQEIANARREVEEANLGLEARVLERTADLGKANEEIQRFAYIVTHDLRAPLVNIMGFTSELETGVEAVKAYMEGQPDSADPEDLEGQQARLAATEDLPEAVTFIRAATRKMDGLINAILKISREGRRQLKPEKVNLAEVAENSAAAVQHQVAESDGAVETDIRVPNIITDKLSIEQVLGNMLDNAVKYRDPERPLRIAIRGRHTTGNRVVLEIEDNGRGIADTDHERVFELFRRSGSQTQPGEGIGLAHVRTMVRSLGGDVTLRSKLGEGTTFVINLPRDLRGYMGSTGA